MTERTGERTGARAGGRAGERERFVRDFLRHHGAELSGPGPGPFSADLPPALAGRLKAARRLDLVFRASDLAEHGGAALMVPGNPLFDRLLVLARRRGAVSRRYLRADRGRELQSCLPAEGPLAGAQLSPPAYRSQILFTFRIAYRAFDGFDDICSIAVVPAAGDGSEGFAQDGHDFFRGRNLGEEPEPDIGPAPPADVPAALRLALAELERQITPQVVRFTQRAEAQLALESERLRDFYLALIAEEKAQPPRRRGESPPIAATRPKVEWVQRLDREIRLFAPQVIVTLLGLEEVWVPVCRLTAGHGERAVAGELDLATGEVRGVG